MTLYLDYVYGIHNYGDIFVSNVFTSYISYIVLSRACKFLCLCNNCISQRMILQSQELWSKERDVACDVQVQWLYLPFGIGKKLHSRSPNLFVCPDAAAVAISVAN